MISTPLCSGIATFARLGDQVGATWAQKLRLDGPKVVSGTVRTAKPGDFVWSVGKWSVRVMETVGNQPDSSQGGGQSLSKRPVI